MKNIFFLVIICLSYTLSAQIGVGQWRDHLPFNSTFDLIEKDNSIIGASATALFKFDKANSQISKFSVLDGLTETNITSIAYSKKHRAIIIGYNSGNIDIVLDDEIINLPELKNTSNIPGDKKINDIHIHDDFALLSCNFGILKVDLKKNEINDTYRLGFNNSNLSINQTTIFNDTIYGATEIGIFKAYVNNPLLSSSNQWKQLHLQGLMPDSSNINTLASTSTYLMFNKRGEVFNTEEQYVFSDNNIIEKSQVSQIYIVNKLKSIEEDIFMTGIFYARRYTSVNEFNLFVGNGDYNFTNSLLDKNDQYWCSDLKRGLIRIYPNGHLVAYCPSGPNSTDKANIEFDGEQLIVSHGGEFSWGPKYSNKNFSILKNNVWTIYENSEMFDERDLIKLVQDPLDSEKQWGATWGKGIIEYKNYEAQKVYTKENSSIEPRVFDENQYLISDLEFDKNSTLWALSSQSSTPLTSRDKDNNWESYSFGSSLPTSVHSASLEIFDRYNQKWVFTSGVGIIVFDETQNGSKFKKLTKSIGSGALPTFNINTAKMDKDGKIWLGGEDGISVMSNPRNIFQGGNYDVNHILVFFDGNWEPVLKGQNISDIAIDGGNRKWFATNQGVYLTSEDGTEQIHHFTTENSPLLSNTVSKIAINQKTGEVFFATDKGIISFKSDAQDLIESERKVLVYPNPVEPNYDGLITIDGIISNSTVKIADLSGRIVYQTNSEGNRATWDGRSLQGDLASSGVYIVYSASPDGVETEVAKISIVR